MDNYFDEYDAYSENDVVGILPDGIALSDGGKIMFDECAQNYDRHIGNTPAANCIGEKDTDDGSFMLYSTPRPVMIKFFARMFSKSAKNQYPHLV